MEDSERLRKASLWLILSLVAASCMEFYVVMIWLRRAIIALLRLYAPVVRRPSCIYGAPVAAAYPGGSVSLWRRRQAFLLIGSSELMLPAGLDQRLSAHRARLQAVHLCPLCA
jgi:hypothetical protein